MDINNYIGKLTDNFGPEGLIFTCRFKEYQKKPPLKIEQLKILLNSLESIPDLKMLNYNICFISCCLYLLARYDESFVNKFKSKLIGKLNKNTDPITEQYLFTIYNCIDFERTFLHNEKGIANYLLCYLERFNKLQKPFEYYLLFKYYKQLLLFGTGKLKEAYDENNAINMDIEKNGTNNDYINFIKLKNDLFRIKMNSAINSSDSLQNNYNLLNSVYMKVRNENSLLALKLGFKIFDYLFSQSKYEDAFNKLHEMYKVVKDNEKKNGNIKKLLRFDLSIDSMVGVIGVLVSKPNYYNFSVKEMTSGLAIIKNSMNTPKKRKLYLVYDFILTLIKLNTEMFVPNLKDSCFNFYKECIENKLNEQNLVEKDNFLIRDRINECIINLNIIYDNQNDKLKNMTQCILSNTYQNFMTQRKNNLVPNNMIIILGIGFYDQIRCLVESYLMEEKIECKEQIIANIHNFWDFINNIIEYPIVRTNFFKSIIIKIFCCYADIDLLQNNMDKAKATDNLKAFVTLARKVGIDNETPQYELIYKILGDYYFKIKNYEIAINNYINAIKKMPDQNPKKSIIYFNLGTLFYLAGKKNEPLYYFNQAINHMKMIDGENSSFIFHKRNNILKKKCDIIQRLIKDM